MEFEIGANLLTLLQASPWVGLGALVFWPEKGVVSLWIKRTEAVRVAELEKEKIRDQLLLEVAKGNAQRQLPAPVGEKELHVF